MTTTTRPGEGPGIQTSSCTCPTCTAVSGSSDTPSASQVLWSVNHPWMSHPALPTNFTENDHTVLGMAPLVRLCWIWLEISIAGHSPSAYTGNISLLNTFSAPPCAVSDYTATYWAMLDINPFLTMVAYKELCIKFTQSPVSITHDILGIRANLTHTFTFYIQHCPIKHCNF